MERQELINKINESMENLELLLMEFTNHVPDEDGAAEGFYTVCVEPIEDLKGSFTEVVQSLN